MSTEALPQGVRLNRDIVLPPIRRDFQLGHLTIEQAIVMAYEKGLDFGFEAGVQHGIDNPDD